MQRGIRSRLLWAFFAIITALSAASLVFFVFNYRAVQEFKQNNEIMISEYRMVNDTAVLIDAFNVQVQSAGTSKLETFKAKHEATKADIESLITYLDSNISDFESRSNYLGFKASVQKFVQQIDESLHRFQEENIKNYFSDYNEANKQYTFVRENGTTLIFSQLQYLNSIRDGINRRYTISFAVGLAILVLTVMGCILFVFRFAKKLIVPLRNLTAASLEIAKGNTNFVIDRNTLKQTNEIGTLAKSFGEMVSKLTKSQQNLKKKAKESEDHVTQLAEKFTEIERMNKLMINRELKMVELKEEIEKLKSNTNSK